MSRQPDKDQKTAIEQLAGIIARGISQCHCSLVTWLNQRVNRFSKQSQKWALLLFCLVSSGVLLFMLMGWPNRTVIPNHGHAYQPSHIGQPSGHSKPNHDHLRDSLTTKK